MENVVELSSRRSFGHVSEAMGDLETRVGSIFVHAFAATLKACDDAFSIRAEDERVSARQTRYFDDLRALRRCQSTANTRFRNACSAMFNQLNGSDSAHSGDPELRIVGDDDLEFDLALFRIAKRCDDAAPRIRHQVERRFQVLLGLAEGTAAPLSGSSLARLCRIAISALDLPIDARLIILKRLERDFAAITEPALESANSIMLEHGVLPNLRAMPGKPGASMSTSTHHATPAPSAAHPQPSSHAYAPAHAVAHAAAMAAPAVDIQQAISQVSQWIAQQAASEAAAAPMVVRPLAAVPVPADHLADLEATRERRRTEIAERRIAEMSRARELRIAAERSADASVNQLLRQTHVPASLGEVLQGPLRRYLEAIYSRRGDASSDWRIASKLVRDIAWSLDPETLRSEQAHWRVMVPGIVDSLRGALFSIGLDDRKVDAVVGEFRDRYEVLLGDIAVADVAVVADPEAEVLAASEATSDNVVPTIGQPNIVQPTIANSENSGVTSFADALRHVRHFALGQWFELVDDSAALQSAKLIWTSARSERCMFVNRQGKLVADRTHNRIAADFLAGQFRALKAAH